MRASRHGVSGRGFSMVELLVAMLIGLIGMIIIFQVFEVSEGIKRTTTSGGDAQQNGVIALYTMERDFKNAGMGFNNTDFVGCNIIGFDNKRAAPNLPPAGVTMVLAPVFITSGAATTDPDQITVLYGSQPQAAGSVPLNSDMDATKNGADNLFVKNPFGYNNGDLLIMVEPGTAKNCSIMEVTKVSSNEIFHDLNSYLAAGTTRNPRFNKAGGLGVVYQGTGTANVARVFNLGNLYTTAPGGTAPVNFPVYNVYAVANGSLTVTSQFTVDNGQPVATSVADNIVHMRALYGLDDGVNDGVTVTYNTGPAVKGDGIVDRYVDAATFNALAPLPWANLIAVRVALVSRSALPETTRDTVGNILPCTTTQSEPTWTGTAWATTRNYKTRLDVSAIVAAPDDWKCYRYRVFETTIPLRNWIWKAS